MSMINFFLLLFISVLSPVLSADEFSTQIKTAKLTPYNNYYQLSADIDYNLSPTAIEAIQSNIALTWHLNIKLKKIKPLWNTIVFNQLFSYTIRYHALLNSYSVGDSSRKKNKRFTSLTAALASISKIRNLNFIKTSIIEKNSQYTVAIKLEFDREALPLPLRPIAYLDNDWDLSSHWYLWTLQP
ncbi:MAG: DUF4390 domain-containing protein [Methylococcales bacterium]|nr:DUF4390 domain-containing protein [Methylococcales bacterium]